MKRYNPKHLALRQKLNLHKGRISALILAFLFTVPLFAFAQFDETAGGSMGSETSLSSDTTLTPETSFSTEATGAPEPMLTTFALDTPGFTIGSGVAYLSQSGNGTKDGKSIANAAGTFAAAKAALGSTGGTIYIVKATSVNVEDPIYLQEDEVWDGGHNIIVKKHSTFNSNVSQMILVGYDNLTPNITFKDIIISGMNEVGVSTPAKSTLVRIVSGSTLRLQGAILQDNALATDVYDGSALSGSIGTTLYMDANTIIQNNTAKDGIGGISMSSVPNKAPAYLYCNGATIRNNSGKDAGGIKVGNGNDPTYAKIGNGTKIIGNTATVGAGGISINTPDVTIETGVIISGNTGGEGGGFSSRRNITIPDGVTIENNTAVTGGGIFFNNCTLTLQTDTIRNNSATNGGGIGVGKLGLHGILLLDKANFTLSQNKATDMGGGIYIANGSVSVGAGKTATITKNYAPNGGGVAMKATIINTATLDTTIISIKDNGAATNGGGLYLNNAGVTTGTLTALVGATTDISNNYTGVTAPTGPNWTLDTAGKTVSNVYLENTATATAGGAGNPYLTIKSALVSDITFSTNNGKHKNIFAKPAADYTIDSTDFAKFVNERNNVVILQSTPDIIFYKQVNPDKVTQVLLPDNKSVTATLKPTDADDNTFKFAFVEQPSGTISAGGWQQGSTSDLTFAGLKPGTTYKVIAQFIDGSFDANKTDFPGYEFTTYAPPIAKIGSTIYTSLDAAITAAKVGETITLLADVSDATTTVINKSITIDGDGHTIESIKATGDVTVTLTDIDFEDKTTPNATLTAGAKITIDATVNDLHVDITNPTSRINVAGDINKPVTITTSGSSTNGQNLVSSTNTTPPDKADFTILPSTKGVLTDGTYLKLGDKVTHTFGVMPIEFVTTGTTTFGTLPNPGAGMGWSSDGGSTFVNASTAIPTIGKTYTATPLPKKAIEITANDVKYEFDSFDDTASNNGKTMAELFASPDPLVIKLLADVDITKVLTLPAKAATLTSVNGSTLKNVRADGGDMIHVVAGGSLTVSNVNLNGNGKAGDVIDNLGTVTLEQTKIVTGNTAAIAVDNHGTLKIDGSKAIIPDKIKLDAGHPIDMTVKIKSGYFNVDLGTGFGNNPVVIYNDGDANKDASDSFGRVKIVNTNTTLVQDVTNNKLIASNSTSIGFMVEPDADVKHTFGYATVDDAAKKADNTHPIYVVHNVTIDPTQVIPGRDIEIYSGDRVVGGDYRTDVTIEHKQNANPAPVITIGDYTFSVNDTNGDPRLDYAGVLDGMKSELNQADFTPEEWTLIEAAIAKAKTDAAALVPGTAKYGDLLDVLDICRATIDEIRMTFTAAINTKNTPMTEDDTASITIERTSPNLDYALVDKNGTIVTSAGGAGGWQTNVSGGSITFTPVVPGGEYTVITVPKADPHPTSPITNPTGTVVIAPVSPPRVTDISKGLDPSDSSKAFIEIKPANKDFEYAIIDPDTGKIVNTGSEWLSDTTAPSEVKFPNLLPGKEYIVVAREIATGDNEALYALPGISVVTPFVDVKAGMGNGTPYPADKTYITVSPTDSDYDYAIVDETTGKIISTDGAAWHVGTNGDMTFGPLDPNHIYRVVTEEHKATQPTGVGDIKPDGGVRIVTPATQLPVTVESTTDKSITISPTNPSYDYAVVDPDTGNVIDGQWITNPAGGAITFSPLLPGKDYVVVDRPKITDATVTIPKVDYRDIPTTDGSALKPAVTKFPLVTGAVITGSKTSITVNPTNEGYIYAVVDETGAIVTTAGGTNGWQTSTDGNNDDKGDSLTFTGLDPGKTYKVIEVPTGTNTADPSLPAKPGVSIVTPTLPLSHADVKGTTTNSITVNPTNPTYEYAIIDPITGKPVGEWKTGSGSTDLTFPGLVAGKEYEVAVRVPNTDPSKTVVVGPTTTATTATPATTTTGTVTFSPGVGGSFIGTAPTELAHAPGYTFQLPPASVLTPPAGKVFGGWTDGTHTYPSGGVYTMPNGNVTLQPKWLNSSSISGHVTDSTTPTPIAIVGATVELKRGDETIVAPTATNGSGDYEFTAVPPGSYNIVITTTDGHVVTRVITVTGGEYTDNATIPDYFLNTKLEVIGGVDVVVGKLDEQMNALLNGLSPTEQTLVKNNGSAELKFMVSDAPSESILTADKTVITNNVATGFTVGQYLDLKALLTITANGVKQPAKTLDSLPSLVQATIWLPENLKGKAAYSVIRSHFNGTIYTSDVLSATANGAGEKIVIDFEQDIITIYTKTFSTYALAYSNTVPPTPPTPTPSSGGSDTISPADAIIKLDPNTTSGTISVTPSVIMIGQKVTVTVKPDDGYYLRELTVVDPNGTSVTYTSDGNNQYSFFPAIKGSYLVTPVFVAYPEKSGVSTLLNTKDHLVYILGDNHGNVNATKNITRAEAAAIFYRLLNNQNVTITNHFTDVPDNAWYKKNVEVLASLGILVGNNGKFEPNRNISRAEFAAICERFATATTLGTRTFTDVATTHWAYNSIQKVSGFGWFPINNDGSFKPERMVTRAEAVIIVNSMLGRNADTAFVNTNTNGLKAFHDLTKKDAVYYEIAEAANGHEFEKTGARETWKKTIAVTLKSAFVTTVESTKSILGRAKEYFATWEQKITNRLAYSN